MLAAVKQHGEALYDAAAPLKADREFVLAAVKQHGWALQYAAAPLKADREVVLAAVQQHGEALYDAAKRLRDNTGFVLAASRLNPAAHAAAARILGADTLRELEAAAAVLYRIKVVLLGHGGAGKTCLRRRLADGVFLEQLPATDGIEMNELELVNDESEPRKLSVFLWDLAGLDEYLATHPFFIDETALFALVVSLELFQRSNHANVAASLRLLRTVRARARNAPIALVGTHADCVAHFNDIMEQLRVELETACPGALTPGLVFAISSRDGDGLDRLQAQLAAHALTLDHVRDMVPAPYTKLQEQLNHRAAIAPHLPLDDVVAVATSEACRVPVASALDATIPDAASTVRALKKLSSWGAIHFCDSPALRETVVLRPQWLADAMACVIGPKNAAAAVADAIVRTRAARRCELVATGKLEHSQVDRLWCAATIAGFDEANVALCRYLLATMHAFELAYPLRDDSGAPTGVSLVPSMLPAQRPIGATPFAGLADDGQTAKMEIRLSFLPQELFPRLIVRLQQYVQDADCWFDAHALSSGGVVLGRGDGAASNRAAVTMGGHFDAHGVWVASAAYATSIVIDARGEHPAMLRGLAWRCLETLRADYEGVEATASLLSATGGAVDLLDAQDAIREGRPVRTRGEVLLVDDLKPGALVTGARDVNEARFDNELASAPPGPGDWRARTVALIERTYLGPEDMCGHMAPPLLWLLVPTNAAGDDGSWREHEHWTDATFALAALSEPPEDEVRWALTSLRVAFDATSEELVHAAPYLLRVLRVAVRVGVRGLDNVQDAVTLADAVEAKVALLVSDHADGPPPARRQRVGPGQSSDARPVLTPRPIPLAWAALGEAAREHADMVVVPDRTRPRAVWMARSHMSAAMRAIFEENERVWGYLREMEQRRQQEEAFVAAPPSWQLLDPAGPEYADLRAQLLASEPNAFDVAVWKVQHGQAERRFTAESKRIGSERLLWHSPGKDPLTLIRSDFPFDFTRSNATGGSYGKGIYFSEHASYGGRILPCRVSELDAADGLAGQPPAVGDDLMLGDGLETYNVLHVDADGTCLLRRLRWNAQRREQWHADIEHRLGDGEHGTVRWRQADRRYAILTAVALGNVHPLGREFRQDLQRAPDGCHPVSGTEGDLHIEQVTNRSRWYEEWKDDMAPLLEWVLSTGCNTPSTMRYRRALDSSSAIAENA